MPRLSEEEKARRAEARRVLNEQKKQAAELARAEAVKIAAAKAEAARQAREEDIRRKKEQQESDELNADINRERERLRAIAEAHARKISIEQRKQYLEKMKAIARMSSVPPEILPPDEDSEAEESADSLISCSEESAEERQPIDWDIIELP